MCPVEHTYPWLIVLLRFAFYNFHFRTHEQHLRRQQGQNRIRGGVMSAPGWKANEVESYLKSGGIGGGLIRRLKRFSTEHRESHPNDLEDAFTRILPPLWFPDGCEIWHHHDAVFHLLYHGLVPCAIDMVVGSLKEYTGIRGDFHHLCNPILRQIHSLQLADCLVLPFGEDLSTAGWIGSNKYGFSRLLPFLCSHLHRLAETKFPNNPTKTGRCLSVCKGIQRMVTCLYSLLSRVMQRTTSETMVEDIDDFVKLFLYESVWLQSRYLLRKKYYIYSTGKNTSRI
jgi:hypothetical protein